MDVYHFRYNIIFILLLFSVSLEGQPVISFSKCFGGSAGDAASSIVERKSDHTFLVAGSSTSNDGDVQSNYGGVDTWIINIDTSGQILWSTVCGGSNNDIPEQIINTHDGGFAILGYTLSSQVYAVGNNLSTIGQEDIWLMKFSANFSLQWQKCLGGLGSDVASLGKGLIETSSHEFVVIGSTRSNDSIVSGNHGAWDYYVVKIDSVGNIIWQKCLGGTFTDIGYSVCESPDHDYLLIGSSESNDGDVSGNHGGFDFWVLKIDTSGSIIWQKSIGGTSDDYGRCLTIGYDSSIVFTGTTNSNDGDVSSNHGTSDIFLSKTDSNGNTVWNKCYGGTDGENIYSIKVKKDSTFLFCGYSNSIDGDVTGVHGFAVDGWIVNINSSSNIIWQKSIGGSFDDIALDLIEGNTSDVWISASSESNDGDVSTTHGTSGDFWIVRLDLSLSNSIEMITGRNTYSLFPNPFSTTTTISLDEDFQKKGGAILLFNQLGSDCTNKINVDFTPGELKITNIDLIPGIYYLCISGFQYFEQRPIKLIIY